MSGTRNPEDRWISLPEGGELWTAETASLFLTTDASMQCWEGGNVGSQVSSWTLVTGRQKTPHKRTGFVGSGESCEGLCQVPQEQSSGGVPGKWYGGELHTEEIWHEVQDPEQSHDRASAVLQQPRCPVDSFFLPVLANLS